MTKTAKIALSGACGRMGRVIAALVAERGDCEISAGIDCRCEKYAEFEMYYKITELETKPDVVLDFSHPSSLSDTLAFCKKNSVPVVIATTGYSAEEVDAIKSAAVQIPVFFTGNMSLGINLLADLARRTARVLGNRYDMEIIEKHHNRKVDAPSGTAFMLADALNEERGNTLKYVYGRSGSHKPRTGNELGIHAVRGGTVVGEHEVIFAGHDEIISLSHSALSREVFANGAINAALYLAKQEKGLYSMTDLLATV
ncbi:MAG: 4-hydroxy-tetrahydrodipicolinate reductase [Oscillospiraceae bacterium]|jgi:4-hydroxy-tetrahydrodipicolinate reductase|nr:4-hydroxy-tetrahydrodipicolinate reductase [Oscillospiraceae bacterium]